jgi:hypothetical protein
MMYPNTYITRFYGMHRIKMPHIRRKIHFVVMQSVFYGDNEIHEMYDLKGSTVGRAATEKEKARGPSRCVYKDLDLMASGTKIKLGPGRREAFLAQMASDAAFLERMKIMDYSLLLGIHYQSKRHVAEAHALAHSPGPVSMQAAGTAVLAATILSKGFGYRAGSAPASITDGAADAGFRPQPAGAAGTGLAPVSGSDAAAPGSPDVISPSMQEAVVAARTAGRAHGRHVSHAPRTDMLVAASAAAARARDAAAAEEAAAAAAAAGVTVTGTATAGATFAGGVMPMAEAVANTVVRAFTRTAADGRPAVVHADAVTTALAAQRGGGGGGAGEQDGSEPELEPLPEGDGEDGDVDGEDGEGYESAEHPPRQARARGGAGAPLQRRGGGRGGMGAPAGGSSAGFSSGSQADETPRVHFPSPASSLGVSTLPSTSAAAGSGGGGGGGSAPPAGVPAPTAEAGGGIPAIEPDGGEADEIYYMGIIDILQQYDLRKMGETVLKSFVHPVSGISSVSPRAYADRFVRFMGEHTS